MDRLHNYLTDFVKRHVQHNTDWQSIDVILSGHDVCLNFIVSTLGSVNILAHRFLNRF